MNLYSFNANYIDGYTDMEETESGLILAEDPKEAVSKLMKTYGTGLFEFSIKEEGIEHELVVVPKELLPTILEKNYW